MKYDTSQIPKQRGVGVGGGGLEVMQDDLI